MQTTAHKIGTLGLATATVLGLTAFQSAEAASMYTVTDLGTLSGRENDPHVPISINNVGQIVGRSGLLFDEDRRAFLWDNGVMTDLGSLEGLRSEALDINDSGQIVGHSEINTPGFFPYAIYPSHAFLWENGVMTDLGTLGGLISSAISINNSGQVVGWAENEHGEQRAFLWENGEMMDIGTLGGSTSLARDINNSGQIVGNAQPTTGGNGHAFLWENGVMTDLGTLGGSFSIPNAINDSGQVVGYVNLSGGGSFNHRAFLWQDGTMTDLGTLDDLPTSEALDINNAGQIVGNAYDFDDFLGQKPFLWENGVMIDINSLFPADSGFKLFAANNINDVGQITGLGWINNIPSQVLLTPVSDSTPVPEPLTILGSATALGFGALFKREHSIRRKKAKSND
ncbi:MAG: PEP-CTERM sorting domain-containing protein [Coleofasciculus chthonoplastes F1-TOW-03]